MDNKGTLFFDPDDRIYADHFPGNPVVPGSLIIHAFYRVLEQEGFSPKGVNRFRFDRFSSPGTYQYTLDAGPDQVVCCLYQGDTRFAKGRFTL